MARATDQVVRHLQDILGLEVSAKKSMSPLQERVGLQQQSLNFLAPESSLPSVTRSYSVHLLEPAGVASPRCLLAGSRHSPGGLPGYIPSEDVAFQLLGSPGPQGHQW